MISGFTTDTGCLIDVHHASPGRTFLRLEMQQPMDGRRAEVMLTEQECDALAALLKDRDAEVIEVMEATGMTYVRSYLNGLRERGFDVVKRSES